MDVTTTGDTQNAANTVGTENDDTARSPVTVTNNDTDASHPANNVADIRGPGLCALLCSIFCTRNTAQQDQEPDEVKILYIERADPEQVCNTQLVNME